MVLLDEYNLGETTISGNTDFKRNIMMEIRDLVLSSLHIDLHIGIEK